jgi:hypothetical protein
MGDLFFMRGWPRWLSLKQAAEYAHLGQKRLKQLAHEGLITGGQDPESGRGDWIFDRDSLDQYRIKQHKSQTEADLEIRKALGIG